MADRLSYTLRFDVVRESLVAGEVKTEVLLPAGSLLTLRRPKARDIKAASGAGNDVMTGIIMISKLVGMPVDVVEDMDIYDFRQLGEIVQGFTEDGPQT